jgi:hypothetical protein
VSYVTTEPLSTCTYISTSGSSRSGSIAGGQQRVYKLTFQESGACFPPAFLSAWSVTLGNNWTEAEPSNATLPISDTSFTSSSQFANQSTIIFSVPNGTYSYKVSPEAMLGPSSGNVTVKGADVIVEVNGPFLACMTSTNSST